MLKGIPRNVLTINICPQTDTVYKVQYFFKCMVIKSINIVTEINSFSRYISLVKINLHI